MLAAATIAIGAGEIDRDAGIGVLAAEVMPAMV
jgi:hypothetical protein